MKNPKIQVGIAVFVCLGLASSLAFAEQPTRKFFGKGSPFTLEELPAGKLKAKLQTLDPQARGTAMKWLHTFTFPELDAVESLRVDKEGGIYYSCSFSCAGCKSGEHDKSTHDEASAETSGTPTAESTETTTEEKSSEPQVAAAAVSVSSPPAYNSKPDAPFHIYLDFNGAIVEGKQWNASYGVTRWECEAWSTDTDKTTFSDAEQTAMRQVWERMAEDYAPFNVNVTTDVTYDPDNYTGDKNKVGWCLFTNTTDKNGVSCPHLNSGGVAYVGVWGRTDFFSKYQPAWTTPASAANMAEAGSHEIGHNLSLSHDGTTTATYYSGHAAVTGVATSWGPIMGTGYNRNVSQWSQGEYYNYQNSGVASNASYQQTHDDLLAISGKIPYRADDHGNTFGTATAWTSGTVDQAGVIERTNDIDTFTFNAGAGTVTLNASTYKCATGTWGGNLDILLELYDNSGNLIASHNPADQVNASISVSVLAGRYYVMLKPSGAGSPLSSTPSGYTVYGSLGKYNITGNFVLPGVNISQEGGTNVTEGGATDTYNISLGTAPTHNVTVTITPDSQVTVDKASVTFTPTNWSTLQTVTVTAVDDNVEEGAHTGVITHTSTSDDGAFNNIGVGSVIVNITDNDNILVTSPNGGQSYYANTTQNILWNSLMGGNVKIELLKGGGATTIIASTPNNGSYAWSIPQFQAPAADYRIRITSVETPTRTDISDGFFTIIEAPIYFTDLEIDPVFTKTGDWAWGTPSGANAASAAHSGTKMYDTVLADTSWATSILTSKAIDCSNYTNVQLQYFLHALLRNDSGTYPGSFTLKVQVSNNNTWVDAAGVCKTVFTQTGMNTNWVQYDYNIADIADGKSAVYIRWWQINNNLGSYQTTGGGVAVDDIKLTGTYSSPVTTYSVTYNGNGSNGGSVPVDTAKYEQNATVTVLGNSGNLTRTGYIFSGWQATSGGGTSYSPGNTFPMGSEDVTLYAKWIQAYTVTYNGNGSDGGSVPGDSNNYLTGDNVIVLGNTGNLIKSGFIFVGWQTTETGGTEYLAGSTWVMGSSDVILYAKWTAAETYPITFYGNGSNSGTPPSQTKTEGVDLILSGPESLVKTGYDFISWNTADNGSGQTYTVGATYSINAALTLYAQWEISTYTITYSGNDQTDGSAPDNQVKIYGNDIVISGPSTLVRFGYTFNGWNTVFNGSGDTYSAGVTYSTNANLDLFAQWTPDTYTVTYVGNGYTGGSVPASQTKTQNIALTLAVVGDLVRADTTFAGWNTAADGSGDPYASGGAYDGNRDVTLYAQWQQIVTILTEDFETPSEQTVYVKGSLPSNGNWVGANDGANGSKSQEHGITDKAGGDFVAADPNHQAYAFKNTNTGITSALGKIGTLADKATYTITFDVMPLAASGGKKLYTNYRVQLIAFAADAPRNDCGTTPSGSLLLKEVSGANAADGISFSYTTGDISDAAYLGYDIGIRFIGSGSSGVIDNVLVQVSSLATPPVSPFDVWLGDGGSGFSDDSTGDGVPDGLAWALGAATSSTDAHGLMPIADADAEPDYMIFNYRRLAAANNDPAITFTMEFGTSLGSWTAAIPQGTDVIINTYPDGYGTGVDRVEVKLKKATYEVNGKLFSRLKVNYTP